MGPVIGIVVVDCRQRRMTLHDEQGRELSRMSFRECLDLRPLGMDPLIEAELKFRAWLNGMSA